MNTLDVIASKLDADDIAALRRIVKPDGTLRRTAPDWRKDPAAWATWQGIRTALGWHGEGATAKLIMLDEPYRAMWDRVSGAALAARRMLQEARHVAG